MFSDVVYLADNFVNELHDCIGKQKFLQQSYDKQNEKDRKKRKRALITCAYEHQLKSGSSLHCHIFADEFQLYLCNHLWSVLPDVDKTKYSWLALDEMQVTLPYPDKSLEKGKYKGTDLLMRLEKCVSMKIERDHKLDDCPEHMCKTYTSNIYIDLFKIYEIFKTYFG
ncbi:Hypothetical predicted protein [Paramuricea clavata]|uniref:Uncharacterized protein n=1 Tax=Paramuricea clavata TaxID=317549 RepID=A0A7D9M853_PARCT|nr:Hypothetical predicted protein [Paramuricea clavata]